MRFATKGMSGMSGLSGIAGGSDPYAAIKASLLAYYKFESDGADSTPNARNLTLVNTPTFASAKIGNGISCTATGNKYAVGVAPIIPSGSFWVGAWFKLLISQVNTGILGHYKNPASGPVMVDTFGGSDKLRIGFFDNAAGATFGTTTGTYFDGLFHRIDAWYDGASGYYSIDGGAAIAVATPNPLNFSGVMRVANYLPAFPVYTGDVIVDELMVSTLVPTAAQIALMYNAGSGYALY